MIDNFIFHLEMDSDYSNYNDSDIIEMFREYCYDLNYIDICKIIDNDKKFENYLIEKIKSDNFVYDLKLPVDSYELKPLLLETVEISDDRFELFQFIKDYIFEYFLEQLLERLEKEKAIKKFLNRYGLDKQNFNDEEEIEDFILREASSEVVEKLILSKIGKRFIKDYGWIYRCIKKGMENDLQNEDHLFWDFIDFCINHKGINIYKLMLKYVNEIYKTPTKESLYDIIDLVCEFASETDHRDHYKIIFNSEAFFDLLNWDNEVSDLLLDLTQKNTKL